MPEILISPKIHIGLAEDAEDFGDELTDDFYLLLTIGDDEFRLCTLRELLMDEVEMSEHATTSLELRQQIARFRGVAKHASDAALQVRKLEADWTGVDEETERPDPRECADSEEVAIWDAQLAAGRQALAKHGIRIITEEALADAYHAMNQRGDKAIKRIMDERNRQAMERWDEEDDDE